MKEKLSVAVKCHQFIFNSFNLFIVEAEVIMCQFFFALLPIEVHAKQCKYKDLSFIMQSDWLLTFTK